jgi:SMODS-associated and fused to various effectors sensor domain
MSDLSWDVIRAVIGSTVWFLAGLSLAWWWDRRRYRRMLAALRRYEAARSLREVALILSVRDDISTSARAYLEKSGKADLLLRQVHQPEGFAAEQTWYTYLARVKDEARTLRELDIGRIYLFTNIPVALAVLVGGVLTNGPEVVVHHWFNGAYAPVGRLTFETVKV